MYKRTVFKTVCAAIFLAWAAVGCAPQQETASQAAKPAGAETQKAEQNVYTGPIVGTSNKAKTISITVGQGDKAKTMMVRFDDNTKGLEFADKGEAAIIAWEQRGEEKFATVIKPKLAKLPDGVTEIKVDEMHDLVTSNVPLYLVDARPEMRYDQAHLPGAVNVPVPLLKKQKAAVLPEDKDRLLVFYCGGYT